jgi:hypothetical protein
MHLFEALAQRIAAWRENQYKHHDYPAIGEILEWVRNPDVPTFRLRAPQIRALETYWYLRLVENTPHIFELYTDLFPKVTERLDALGLTHPDMRELALDIGIDGVIEKVREDDDFVKKYKLEALRETLTLSARRGSLTPLRHDRKLNTLAVLQRSERHRLSIALQSSIY